MPVLLVALLIPSAVQDTDEQISKLILQLSSDSAEVRAKAEAALVALGPKAIPALRKAGAPGRGVLAEIERLEIEKTKDAENRKKFFPYWDSRGEIQNTYRFEVEGGRYKAAVYEDKGGLALYTAFHAYPTEFDFDVVHVLDSNGKPLEIERCAVCSPTWVHVKTGGPVKVKYAGVRRWFSEYDVAFENPKEGDQKRIGDFTLTVRWPEVIIASSRAWSNTAPFKLISAFVFENKDPEKTPKPAGGGGGGRYGGKFPPKHTSWCMCEGGPKPPKKAEPLPPFAHAVGYLYADMKGLVMPELKDVARIQLTFQKPVEERFESETKELKVSKVLGER
jgi:hypothetical protein